MPTAYLQPTLTDEERNTIPVASQELFDLAKLKGAELTPNTEIRLTAHAESWTLFNFHGTLYIGRKPDSPIKPFFKLNSRDEVKMTDKDGNVIELVQRLYRTK